MSNIFSAALISVRLAALCALLLAGCASAESGGAQRLADQVAAQSGIALLATSQEVWLAWSGDLIAPDLHLKRLRTGQTWRFPISGAPSDLRLLPLAERRLALLWLERSAGGAPSLQVAVFEADGNLRRAPFEIGAAQRYAALPTPIGGVVALSLHEGALAIHVLDRLGRPYGKLAMAERAHRAAAALDGRDRLHLLWLSPADGALWQLLYASFDLALLDQSAPRPPAPTLLAVLRLAEGEYIESLGAAADSERLYALWNVVSVSARGESARLAGLSFPLEAPLESRALDLSALPADLRAINLPFADAAQGGAPTLVGSRAGGRIVFGALTGQGVFRLREFEGAARGEILSGGVAAALSANNALHLAWLAQDSQGRAGLRYAVFPRPQPAVAPR